MERADQISATELGEMRRELLRILDDAEPHFGAACRKDVCERIQRLCRDGIIPESIGDCMHLVRKYRNRAEYQDRVPEGKEAHAIRSVWAAIEDWRLHGSNRDVGSRPVAKEPRS